VIDYDNVANIIRIRGKNVSENEHVKVTVYEGVQLQYFVP
jgi:hypothetical protein